jgi:PAS domain S-box-containing protein
MKKITPTREELLERVHALEGQLLSQADIQALIEELHVHQEEVRVQNAALFETQRELEASRDGYAELYDFAPMALASLDSNGTIVALNVAGAKLLGTERQRALGIPFLLYVHERDRRRLLDYLARCRREVRAPGAVELELQGADEALPIELHCKRFQSSGAEEPLFFSALIDLRERRRADAERLRAAFERDRLANEEASARLATEAKDRFLAVLSHELRTPLTPILLTLDRLDEDVSDAAATRRALDTIRRNLAVETRLIDDLLDITRIERDRLHLADETVDLHAAIRHAVDMCADELGSARLGLEVELGAQNPHVRGDGTRLRQVFWNLLTNALRYTAPGGSVRVRTYDRDGSVLADVTDTGSGVAPEDLERVFEPFEQAGRSATSSGLGLGLGLAICRGLVRAHGGTIRAASRGQGTGTTFTVELPTCAPRTYQAETRRGVHATHAGLRILLVEDNDDTAEAMATLLRRHGYDVDTAHTLDEARRSATARFDVLVSDVQLPDGSGRDLLRELAAQGPVPAIAMSGFGTDTDVQQSLDAGFAKHLVKPVGIERVLEAIEEIAGPEPARTLRGGDRGMY